MSDSIKHAVPDHPILDLLAKRWSPYAFDPRPVERDKLLSCLEAARWSASSYNEQPWTFLIAERDDTAEFARLLDCLVPANQDWAKHAGVLMLTVVARNFTRNGNPNRVAVHDIGLAAANLTMQATALGLYVHQMAGIEIDKARQTYAIPQGYDPMTGIALGYTATPNTAVDDNLRQRDQTPRPRKPLSQIVYRGMWGQAGA